jgi:uncharacterized cysteine cluster protein YcgN (CxxCxxCC family)
VERFWENTPLDRLSPLQWEALCDGCGRCCLNKFKKPKTGKVYYTWVACFLLDIDTCRCTGYDQRHVLAPDCLELTPANISQLRWLPSTCAYRRIAEKKPLPPWHPLLSGNRQSVHDAGISVRGRAISETLVPPEEIDTYKIQEKF